MIRERIAVSESSIPWSSAIRLAPPRPYSSATSYTVVVVGLDNLRKTLRAETVRHSPTSTEPVSASKTARAPTSKAGCAWAGTTRGAMPATASLIRRRPATAFTDPLTARWRGTRSAERVRQARVGMAPDGRVGHPGSRQPGAGLLAGPGSSSSPPPGGRHAQPRPRTPVSPTPGHCGRRALSETTSGNSERLPLAGPAALAGVQRVEEHLARSTPPVRGPGYWIRGCASHTWSKLRRRTTR